MLVKLLFIISAILIHCSSFALSLYQQQVLKIPTTWIDPMVVAGSYSFDSENNQNFNKFSGSFQTYHLGIWHRFSKNVIALSANRDDISSHSQLKLAQNLTDTRQNSQYNNFTITLYHYFTSLFQINAFAGGSKNTYHISQTSSTPLINIDMGDAVYSGRQVIAGAGAGYSLPLKVFLLTGTANYNYINLNQDSFSLGFAPNLSVTPATTIQVQNLTERLLLNLTASKFIQPYVDVGFLQTLQAPKQTLNTFIMTAGGLPLLDVPDNGINYGGGLALFYRTISGLIGFEYFKRGNSYTSPVITGRLIIPL